MDLKNMKARKVCTYPRTESLGSRQLIASDTQVGVFTDPNVAKLTPMKNVCSESFVSL